MVQMGVGIQNGQGNALYLVNHTHQAFRIVSGINKQQFLVSVSYQQKRIFLEGARNDGMDGKAQI